jgi:tetratricopeptide (TPR) repeat protein
MPQKQKKNLESLGLDELCALVTELEYPYDDLADYIENRTYELATEGKADFAIEQLRSPASFFERMENKNEEVCRDLADIYVLIGETCQCAGQYEESIEWFKKSSVVDDRNSVCYHNLANSYSHLGDTENAIRSLEEEIRIAPGNYFAYFRLADLYEGQGKEERLEECYRRLLERDPDNVQALHRLIRHYEKGGGEAADVTFLRRRLVATQNPLNKAELIVWTFQVCVLNQHERALAVLDAKEEQASELSIVHLLKAHVHGEMRQFTKKRQEIQRFVEKNCGRPDYMKTELREFAEIFGDAAAAKLKEGNAALEGC